jgi:two-component system sensor histidine kinase UhpB
MTLRLKINLIVGALTLLFLAAVLGLQLRSMRDSVHEEVVAANRVASQLLNRTVWLYAAQGTPAMLSFLQGTGRIRSNDITLFDKQGQALYRSPPSTYKAGRDAPHWFAALIAPEPTVQAIEFPDGKLEVRSNASRAAVDAWDYALTLVGAALALLVVVNLLVFWLVGRTVRPFGRAIGAAFNRMVGELQRHIETERRAVRAETQLSDSRELTRWIDHHIEQERLTIARELHDELGQSVTAMRSMATSIAQRCAGKDLLSEQAARLIAEESSRLYDAMHGIIPRLTPLVLDNFGLADAIADLVERTRQSHAGVRIDSSVALGEARLPADVALALYRAAQEGLTNALRHGQAQHVSLQLQGASTEVTLNLRDDGRGLPAGGLPRDGHYGLRWLRERVEALHGSVAIENVPPRGAQLTVRLPLSPETA